MDGLIQSSTWTWENSPCPPWACTNSDILIFFSSSLPCHHLERARLSLEHLTCTNTITVTVTHSPGIPLDPFNQISKPDESFVSLLIENPSRLVYLQKTTAAGSGCLSFRPFIRPNLQAARTVSVARSPSMVNIRGLTGDVGRLQAPSKSGTPRGGTVLIYPANFALN